MKKRHAIANQAMANWTNIHLLPVFYKAITDKQVLQFSYQRFGQELFLLTFHPQYLKEYNGRWFVFGDADREPYKAYNVPLDRIVGEVRLTIEPNRELRGRILLYGENLEVISPMSLREQIKEILRMQMQQYSENK